MKRQISEHLSYNEVTISQTAVRKGIDNTPNEDQLKNLGLLARKIFEPLRRIVSEERGIDTAICVSSCFRSAKLNTAIGGSKTSQHCKGQAMDIDIDGWYADYSNADLFYIIEEEFNFDQLIWEFGNEINPNWVHVSYVSDDKNRNQVLIAKKVEGKTKYIKVR